MLTTAVTPAVDGVEAVASAPREIEASSASSMGSQSERSPSKAGRIAAQRLERRRSSTWKSADRDVADDAASEVVTNQAAAVRPTAVDGDRSARQRDDSSSELGGEVATSSHEAVSIAANLIEVALTSASDGTDTGASEATRRDVNDLEVASIRAGLDLQLSAAGNFFGRVRLPSFTPVVSKFASRRPSVAISSRLDTSRASLFAELDQPLARALSMGAILLLDADVIRRGGLETIGTRQEIEAFEAEVAASKPVPVGPARPANMPTQLRAAIPFGWHATAGLRIALFPRR